MNSLFVLCNEYNPGLLVRKQLDSSRGTQRTVATHFEAEIKAKARAEAKAKAEANANAKAEAQAKARVDVEEKAAKKGLPTWCPERRFLIINKKATLKIYEFANANAHKRKRRCKRKRGK